MWNRLIAIFAVVLVIGQGALAQNILGQFLGLDQGVSSEAAEQAELFPEVGEPEPSLPKLINGEKIPKGKIESGPRRIYGLLTKL